jgi:hypothetical protein
MLRNMRTPILAALLGLSLTGCLIGGDGGSTATGGDDDGTGSNPGSGSDPGSGSQTNPTPAISVTLDNPALATDLLSTNMITATVHATGGFTGAVAMTATAVDSTGATLADWMVTLDKPSVTVTADGDTPVVATVKVPSTVTSLTGTSIKFNATPASGVTAQTAASTVTLTNQITMAMSLDAADTNCNPTVNKDITVAVGTKIHWTNSADKRITIHVNGGLAGLAHEPDPGMAATNGSYDQTPTAAGSTTWYCHAPGSDAANARKITAK